MKRRIFWSVFFTVFLDYRSTNLLRLFYGNLPAMLLLLVLVILADHDIVREKSVTIFHKNYFPI